MVPILIVTFFAELALGAEHTMEEILYSEVVHLEESVPSLELFFIGLFVFNIFHMYLAGATGYGIYTTIFSHFLNDDMQNYGRPCKTLSHA